MVARVKALGEWKACLQRGVLPDAGAIPWPAEPLSSTLAAVLSDLEMPRFCRRFPGLLNTVLNQMVGLIKVGMALHQESCPQGWRCAVPFAHYTSESCAVMASEAVTTHVIRMALPGVSLR